MSAEWPQQTVALDFPWTTCGTFQAQVVGWHAPVDPRSMHDQLFDIAVLRLTDEVPIEPARLELGETRSETAWKNLDFSIAGFPPNKPYGDIAFGQTSGLLPGHRVQVFRKNEFTGKIQPGFSGAPALADERVVGMAFAADMDPKGVGYLVPSYRLEQAWLLAQNPYKGLARFEPEDKDFFFGRTSEADELLVRLARRMVIIVGPTGSGKSSLVFGGLVPKLSPQQWMVASFRPRFNPLESLVEALTSLTSSRGDPDLIDRWLDWLRDRSANIFRILDILRKDSDRRLLVIADQMEEAFTLCKDDRQRKVFFDVISCIANDFDARACFLCTLRSEFTGRILEDRTLSPAIKDQDFFFLRAIAPEKLPEIMGGPAKKLGVKLKERLIRKLLLDATDETNPLTLLQFVLQRLWLHGKGGRQIGLEDYQAIGGTLREALTQYANAIIDAMDQQDQEIARRLLCQLVNFEGSSIATWSKRPRVKDDLGPEVWAMATLLAGKPADRNETPLVVIRRDAVGREIADLAHESLIRWWQQLRTWLEEARDLEVSLRDLRERMHAWQDNKGALLVSNYALARGRRLLERGNVLGLPDDVRAFINLSISTMTREARQNALRERELALTKNQDITRASRQLLRVEEEAKELCDAVLSELGFDYVNVQLVDKGERTIGTVYGTGQQGNFFSIANHPLDNSDPDLLDIQAHMAAAPPKLEVIAGYDKRFDTFIFRTFGHEQHVRAFAPIVFRLRSVPTETLGWEWRAVEEVPQVIEPGPGDKRVVYQAIVDPSTFDNEYEIIGTLEAGFGRADAAITANMAQGLAETGHRFAGKLRQTTLQHVFETVVQAAHEVMKPTATYCGFAYNSQRACFGYEAQAGEVAWFNQSCLRGQPSTEKITLTPDSSDLDAYKDACPAAYSAGMRAEARVAIAVEDQRRHGVLHLVFAADEIAGGSDPVAVVESPPSATRDPYNPRQSGFCDYDKIYLETLASRAEEAIQLATAVGRQRMFAHGLSNLHRIANALAEQPGAEEMLSKVAGYAMNMFAADLATVYEYDQTKKDFRAEAGLAGRFKFPDQAAPTSLDRGTAPFRLIGLGESQYDNQLYDPIESGPRGNPSFAVREGIKAMAGVILRTRAETFGALFLNYRAEHTFSQEERDLAEALASTAAIAIKNRRMLAPGG